MVSLILYRCSLLLRTYSSDLMEDERLLSTDKSLTDNAKQIILLRMCEKTILCKTMKYVQSMKAELLKEQLTIASLEADNKPSQCL